MIESARNCYGRAMSVYIPVARLCDVMGEDGVYGAGVRGASIVHSRLFNWQLSFQLPMRVWVDLRGSAGYPVLCCHDVTCEQMHCGNCEFAK